MENKYDFLNMGYRRALEKMENLEQEAIIIEEKYGADARLEFEIGIAMVTSLFSHYKHVKISTKDVEHATVNFAIPAKREEEQEEIIEESAKVKTLSKQAKA